MVQCQHAFDLLLCNTPAFIKAKSSVMEISTANIQENVLKLQKIFFAWTGHVLQMTGPYNFETQHGCHKMSDSLFSYKIRFARVGQGKVKRREGCLGLVLGLVYIRLIII